MSERNLRIILEMQMFMLSASPQTFRIRISVDGLELMYVNGVPQVIAMCISG